MNDRSPKNAPGKTLFAKVWDEHVVAAVDDEVDLLHIDRHYLHELTAFQAFDELRATGRPVRSPALNVAIQDHVLSTAPGRRDDSYAPGAAFVVAHRRNAAEFGIRLIDIDDPRQGIVHVVGPEQGLTLPGSTVVCGDSHTCTHGGLGAVAFGIGASDIGHVLATQTLAVRRPKALRVTFTGSPGPHVHAKDMALAMIAKVRNANGFAAEYAGPAIASLPVEARMTLCNMSVEVGARIGMISPDDTTFEYLSGRPFAPKGALFDAAIASWRNLRSDDDARFEREVQIDVSGLSPQITWGTSPEQSIAIDGFVPDPAGESDPDRRQAMQRALGYMGLAPGASLLGLPIQHVFIGSCTNARIDDLRVAARAIGGRTVASGVRAMVVPGSTAVKRQAEAEGLHRLFLDAGFQWLESACSMCAGVNADIVPPYERCVATSNRNYEGRQGRDARTHLASPELAVAAAIAGCVSDPRRTGTSP